MLLIACKDAIRLAALAFVVAALGAAGPAGGPPSHPAPAKPPTNAASPSNSAPAPAAASPPKAPPAQPPAFDPAAVAQALNQVQLQLPTTTNDARLAAMQAQVAHIDASVDQALASNHATLARIEAQLPKLSPRRVRRLNSEERRQRAALMAQAAPLQAEVAQQQALATEIDRIYSLIAERRREGFAARVLQRSPSPLAPDFWTSLSGSFGGDWARFSAIAARSLRVAETAPLPQAPVRFIAGLAAALLLFGPLRLWLERRWRTPTGAQARPGAARRTFRALWIMLVGVGAPTLGAGLLYLSAQWAGLLSSSAAAIAGAGVRSVAWAAAILSLGRVLATDAEPQRRLLSISDGDAARIRLSLWPVAIVYAAGNLIRALNYTVGASLAATIAANCLLSLAYAAAAALILASYRSGGALSGDEDAAVAAARSPAWTLISLAVALAIAATVGAVFSGYTTLAALISGQMFWLGLIAGVTFLLVRLIDDVFTALLRQDSRTTTMLGLTFGLPRRVVIQAGLLISAGLQVAIFILALTLALTPFGQSGELLVSHIASLGGVFKIGNATISPSAIAAGLLAFAVGMGVVHVVRGWVVRRYLPVTGWDEGVRNSVSTGVSYLGVLIAIACAFAVMGLGFQQIALVASALSVGIGFGLQQIVQNFVSGVILLIERPVKVGDWVNVGSVEGDVRRIRVRATEIETFDRSTVIVPNSNLITNNVENKTMGMSRARIKVQITLAKAGDARRAMTLIGEVASAQPKLLKEPAPSVYIEGFPDTGGLRLQAFVFVANPREAGGARSQLLLEVIEKLQAENIALT